MNDLMRFDLHVHSGYSVDSRLTLEEIVEQVTYRGLQGFALTDHNTVAGHAELARLNERYRGYWFVPGVEVSTAEGHLLAYGIAEAPPPGRPLAETVERVHALGGVAVLAHPLRWVHGSGRRAAQTAPVDAIEGRNGKNSEISNRRAELLAARRAVASTGGSDAHERAFVGRAFTEFPDPISSASDLLEQLRHARATSGGESLAGAGRVRAALRNGLLRASRGFRPVGPRAAHPDHF